MSFRYGPAVFILVNTVFQIELAKRKDGSIPNGWGCDERGKVRSRVTYSSVSDMTCLKLACQCQDHVLKVVQNFLFSVCDMACFWLVNVMILFLKSCAPFSQLGTKLTFSVS